jgi:hypothetical protein
MDLENILSVTGLPGLYKLVTTRSNGIVIEDLDSGKKTFISMRKHQFTPLESIGIYTYTDVADITEVFMKIDALRDDVPMAKAQGQEFHDFFRKALPDFDENRVHLSDIKKVVKWYWFLKERGMLDAIASDEEE